MQFRPQCDTSKVRLNHSVRETRSRDSLVCTILADVLNPSRVSSVDGQKDADPCVLV